MHTLLAPNNHTTGPVEGQPVSLEVFCSEAKSVLTDHFTVPNMLSMSQNIRKQILHNAQASTIAMLPSFNYTLPSGKEKGTYLALDIGGSTLRVALVELLSEDCHINFRRVSTCPITDDIKRSEGRAFFAWVADRIHDLLVQDKHGYGLNIPLLMGVSWSFPIQQTSSANARILPMGKGFQCFDDAVGQDLNQMIREACSERFLSIRMVAIINDSSATLLSRAYLDPSTRMSLIMGTGTNSAAYLPVQMIPREKFGNRYENLFSQVRHVIVNTELGLLGGDNVLPRTRWDETLNYNHIKPDFQPLEYMTSGAYLGEIVRLIILDAVLTAGLFGGSLPSTMADSYSFDTLVMAVIESDTSPMLRASSDFLQHKHDFPEPPSWQDLSFLKRICSFVSTRAAAYVAISLHGLSSIIQRPEAPLSPAAGCRLCEKTNATSLLPIAAPVTTGPNVCSIACDGTVITKYPNFRVRCQEYLDQLFFACRDKCFTCAMQSVSSSEISNFRQTSSSDRIVLSYATESCLYGTAVASAIAASVPPTPSKFPN